MVSAPLVQIDGNPAQFLIDAEGESLLGNRPLMYTRYCLKHALCLMTLTLESQIPAHSPMDAEG
jgi:hypothetical protein